MKFIRNLQALKSMKEKVIIPNFIQLESKIKNFPQNLALISDFDFTMTRYNTNGYKVSTIQLLRCLLPDQILSECDKLFNYYHPIELNFNLDPSVRSKHMEKWWTKEYSLIAKSGIRKSSFSEIIENSHLYLRFGVIQTLEHCRSKNIPVHVLSAGIGNFIKIIFESLEISCDIRSNFFYFNGQEVSGFQKPLIHSANKSASVKDFKYDGVVVVGDMPSDIASVPESAKTSISIGYLNDLELYKLDDFLQLFDIVVMEDGDFLVVKYILDLVTQGRSLIY